jgi:hypothetical protein
LRKPGYYCSLKFAEAPDQCAVRPGGACIRVAGEGAKSAPRPQRRRFERSEWLADLRLRPDPASTPVALSTVSAYQYYETVGQNWERAALIKARPAAGDLKLGGRFLADLAPFIWRKYFDYAAIADIHSMKRQIHAVRGHEQVVVPGHEVKLGRGGICEIEFFVQTQQFIFWRTSSQMRGSRIVHRLQMIADEQTSASRSSTRRSICCRGSMIFPPRQASRTAGSVSVQACTMRA